MVKHWNTLHREVMESSLPEVSKKKVDMAFRNMVYWAWWRWIDVSTRRPQKTSPASVISQFYVSKSPSWE